MITFAEKSKIMANKTFNIYCDESCHLEHDHKPYMLLGNISCAYPQVKRHSERIKEIKKKHHLYAEIKWTNVSRSKLQFYLELIDYFFDTDLKFRAIGVQKEYIQLEEPNTTFDDFYYKMYYRLLNYKVDTTDHYNVYLDIKDTWSNTKANRLRDILNVQFGVFRKVQCIRSEESLLLQMADLLMGAIAYEINVPEKRSGAKEKVLAQIKKHCPDLAHSNSSNKLNLFFINLK